MFIKDGRLTPEFYEELSKLSSKLEEIKIVSTLPDKPNYDKINEFVMSVNEKVITNTVYYYKEPLKEVLVY